MPRTAARTILLVACAAMLLVAACGEAAPIARTAAQRIDDAVALIAKTLDKSTTEVRTALKGKLPAATEEELAVQAERTAARTAEIERLAAGEAARLAAREARLRETADTLYGAACDWLDIADDLASAPPGQRDEAFQAILARKLAEHAFDTGESNMNALGNAVKSLIGSGSDRSLDEIATDLACFAA